MDFDHLWAPWRMSYITGLSKDRETPPNGCVFCAISQSSDDRNNRVIKRATHTYAVLNIFPYNNGHSMVIPYSHVASIGELDADTRLEIMDMVDQVIEATRAAMNPDGFNVGMNLGRPAGAGIDQHLHLHVVPRWSGDTNFMTVFGQTRVISESLEDTWEKLTAQFTSLDRS